MKTWLVKLAIEKGKRRVLQNKNKLKDVKSGRIVIREDKRRKQGKEEKKKKL